MDPMFNPQEVEEKDGAAASDKLEDHVYCEFEVTMERAEYEKHIAAYEEMQQKIVAEKESNANDNSLLARNFRNDFVGRNILLVFADASLSMKGKPFEAMQTGMLHISDMLFKSERADNIFDDVHVVFYSTDTSPNVTYCNWEYRHWIK